MNELALFAGAGGGLLASQILGFKTVCAVERDAYCAQVLAQRQNDGSLEPFPIWSDVATFDGRGWNGIVDVISAGIPCQDISFAGKGSGFEGERTAPCWDETKRIICEVRPRFVFVENVTALTVRGLGVILGDMAEIGLNAEWGVLSAADVGANHIRERIWILAYSEHNSGGAIRRGDEEKTGLPEDNRQERGSSRVSVGTGNMEQGRGADQLHDKGNDVANADGTREQQSKGTEREVRGRVSNNGEEVPNAESIGVQGHGTGREQEPQSHARQGLLVCGSEGRGFPNWKVEPELGRMVDGMANRVDRIKAIGNGQVPLCAAEAFRQLMERIK